MEATLSRLTMGNLGGCIESGGGGGSRGTCQAKAHNDESSMKSRKVCLIP